ncbi:MAG: hypothetical protein EP308_04930 [Burkholderiales bacterium]|nr:MAG: hypothetical protein EP308_04930 [Burkholderiales bacterium]
MNRINAVAALSLTLLGSGCASIVTGHNQSVSVETRSKQGEAVASAQCRLTNDKGTWFVTSPGSVSVRRSYGDLLVNCEKPNQEPGVASVKSSTKAMAFGNIIFGGVIGAGVDVASGAAYDYPTLITVWMGEKVTVDAPPTDAAPSPKPEAATDPSTSVASTAQPVPVQP